MKRHKYKILCSKKMELGCEPIDRGIYNVVVWMNSIRGLRTIWSCEGKGRVKPWVVFKSSNKALITMMLQITKHKIDADVVIRYIENTNKFEFRLIFESKRSLRKAENILGELGYATVDM